jgi:REP element-mobilizing transposase RayT
VEFDCSLDRAETGPTWLKDPRVAKLVVEAFQYGQDVLHLYDLKAWVVLSNHIHLLIHPHADLARITEALKGYTASRANHILQRRRIPFWQDESFDHWIRSDAEFRKVVRYIENNPVKAGLVARAEDWPWSSAWGRHPCLPNVS